MLLPVGSCKIKNNLNSFLCQNGRSRALKEQHSIKTKLPQSKYLNFQCLKFVHDFLVSRGLGRSTSPDLLFIAHTACLTCCASSALNLLLSLEVLPWSWHLWYVVVSTATEVRPSRRASHGLLEDSDFVHGTMPHLLSVSSLILESLHLQLRLQIHHSSSQSLTTALHNSFCPAKSTKSSIT